MLTNGYPGWYMMKHRKRYLNSGCPLEFCAVVALVLLHIGGLLWYLFFIGYAIISTSIN